MARIECPSCGLMKDEELIVAGKCSWCRMDDVRANPPVPSFDNIKALARDQVRRMAESLKLSYMTLGSGKAYEYACKAEEYNRYVHSSSPFAGDYPFAQAEMAIQSKSLDEIMSQFGDGISASAVKIASIAAQESQRLRDIDATETGDDALAIPNQAWQL